MWSLVALGLGVALSVWLAQAQQRRVDAGQRADLEAVADALAGTVGEGLRTCELLARSVQSLFLASSEVEPREFTHLYQNLHPRDRLDSLQAVAYAERDADGRYVTRLVAPREGNERVLGLDVASQPPNLAALLAARDSDRPVLSAPFRLLQQEASGTPAEGVTLRLPIFHPGPPPASVAERRERARGSVAISFNVRRLIGDSLPEEIADAAFHASVADVTGGTARPLFDSHPLAHGDAGDHVTRTVLFGGREWRVQVHAMRQPLAVADWSQSILWPGLVASALFALLVWSVLTSRRRALEQGWRMSRRYRESEERFRVLNELLPALVLLARGGDGRITYANQAARLRLGEASGELTLAALFDDHRLGLRMQAGELANGTPSEAVLSNATGDRFWASVSTARVDVGGEDMLLMVATDTSEQRQLTELLGYQASHDALTELYNRREFERRVERVLVALSSGGMPAALLYMDLDQFKLINDTSGHIAGDQLLIQLATAMREQFDGEGVLLARLGGDEFGVLVPGLREAGQARDLAERLRERIDGYVFVWEQRTYTITVSIGGVVLDQPGLAFKDVLAQADTACYMAKEGGRNRVHFYSASDDETARRHGEMEWANRLRWAVAEGRLLLMYQEVRPVSGDRGRPYIELLLRFRDQQGRLVPPGAFLPAAERYGLMPMIDRWVIETALSHFDQLHPSGAGLGLATINLSGASIEDESLVDRILELLHAHGVDPQRVCFEITETVAVRNLSQVGRFLGRLRDAGCKLALDDFGAGMSSFGYLKNLPVDIIKIDGSFIRDLLTDPMSHAIVRAVNDIGHQRGMVVIAEWVSSVEVLDALAAIGVDYAQGFDLHRPEPVPLHRRRG
ncbi:diguanylate cyclase [Lysobacter arseniciresistens ZS79]|uniref:Diguanylate cyclase n=1 Tax=Lysobacter arseniciresistens ZS79 TaxID=913325 RepID=A0A0A0EZK6_9GAMM|nr:diguanylate cyclase [Lysobacter arseniciresistens ZS79]